jgi:hypothetical protein
MNRRQAFALAAALAFGLAVFAVPPAAAQPSYKVSADQLHRVLGQRFPLRYEVPGVLELRVQQPRLKFLPEHNRLGSELVIDASAPALRRSHSGAIDLDFALRYESSDQTIRAHQIRVQSVRLPSLSPDAAAVLDGYARASAERALLEVVLHQLEPRDLALADTMGLEPGSITVTSDGLVIGFIPRPPPR